MAKRLASSGTTSIAYPNLVRVHSDRGLEMQAFPYFFGGVFELKSGRELFVYSGAPAVERWIAKELIEENISDRAGFAGLVIGLAKGPRNPARRCESPESIWEMPRPNPGILPLWKEVDGEFELRGFLNPVSAEKWVSSRIRGGSVPGGEAEIRALTARLESLAHNLPADYESCRRDLINIIDTSRHLVARLLEPAINEKAAAFPQDSYEAKKVLAKWINAELRRVGLAIKCPKTGNACFLVATTGNRPSEGRFVLDYTDESGRRQHPISWARLPQFELMLDPLARAAYGTRTQRSR